MRRAGFLVALAVALAALASGCGGSGSSNGSAQAGSTTPPKQWADQVCGALVTWETSLAARTQTFTTSIAASSSVPDARTKLISYLTDATSLTDRMLGKIDAAGAPDVDKGSQLATDFRAALARTRTVFASAKQQAQALPTTLPRSEFGSRVQRLGSKIESQGNALDSAFTELDKRYDVPELDSAFQSEPACKRIRSG